MSPMTEPHYQIADATLYAGDCLDVLRELPDNSVDSIVTDPPAGIGFMGKEWDDFRRSRNPNDVDRANVFGRTSRTGPQYGRSERENFSTWLAEVMREAYRVVKPGAHMLVWAIPRTSHWTACGIEDAGWVIRDRLHHLFGSGFPKSSRVDRDARYCQCDASAHTSSGTSPELQPDVHTGTGVDAGLAEHAARSVRSENCKALGSPVGCLPADGSDGGLPRQVPAVDLALAPSPADAQARSRSLVLVDGQADGSSRSPCPAPRTDPLASQGSQGLASSETSPGSDTPASSTAALRIDSGSGSRQHHSPRTASSPSAWGDCIKCGKPMAKGLGTALKPGVEDWWLARKPLSEGTVAANVLKHGTGALNVGACKVGTEGGGTSCSHRDEGGRCRGHQNGGRSTKDQTYHGPESAGGRWPANLLLTHDASCTDRCVPECPCAVLDGQSGERPGFATQIDRGHKSTGMWGAVGNISAGRREGFNDSGGASRFFPQFHWHPGDAAPFLYTAKAGSAERPRVKREGAGSTRVAGTPAKTGRRCNICGNQTVPKGGKPWPTCGHEDWTAFATREEVMPSEGGLVAHPT